MSRFGRGWIAGVLMGGLLGCGGDVEDSETGLSGVEVSSTEFRQGADGEETQVEGDEREDASAGADGGEESAVDTAIEEAPACPPPTGIRPSAIAEMAGAHLDGAVYFFGGDNGFPIQCSSNPNPVGDLWKYDVACNQWELLDANSAGPGARTRALGVLDSTHQRLLVFGGRYRDGKEGPYTIYNETWALDLNTLAWELLPTTGDAPTPRWSSAGMYDPVRHQLIVSGGNVGTSGLDYFPSGDTHALDLDSLERRVLREEMVRTPPIACLLQARLTQRETGWCSWEEQPISLAPC